MFLHNNRKRMVTVEKNACFQVLEHNRLCVFSGTVQDCSCNIAEVAVSSLLTCEPLKVQQHM